MRVLGTNSGLLGGLDEDHCPPQLSACWERGPQTSSQESHIYKRYYRCVKIRAYSLNVLFFLTVRKNEKTSDFKLSYQLKSIELKADT